jgi:hypothetical protein
VTRLEWQKLLMQSAAQMARKHKRKPNKTAAESDNEGNDFVLGSSSDPDSTSESEDSDGLEVTNEEIISPC